MALVKFGGGITQMSGSIAGNTFARNRYGNYVRSRTKPVNPNSVLQSLCRSSIGQTTQAWRTSCSAAQRAAWKTYADAIAMKNKLGETTYLSGFNHYCRVNAFRARLIEPIIAAGPTVLALPEKDPQFAVTASVATQQVSISYDATLPWHAIVSSFIAVFMGQPQNATRNFFAGPWKYTGMIQIEDTSPKALAAVMTLVLGQKVWVYARICTGPTDGRLSEPMLASCIVAA
jgi:hypothetical protein